MCLWLPVGSSGFLWFPIGFLEASFRLLMVALSVAIGSLCHPLLVCPDWFSNDVQP